MFVCENCKHDFKFKSRYEKHLLRKKPCKKKENDEIDGLINEINNLQVDEKPLKPLKPLVKWSGGKKDEIKEILKYIPSYETYIEPFVGGGALYFHLEPKKSVIADQNRLQIVGNFFQH